MNYNKLNTLIKERKLSKLWLANESGLSDVTIGKILNGADAKVSSIEAIAAALGLPASYFFDEPNQTTNTATGQQSIAGNNNTIAGNVNIPTPPEGFQTIVNADGSSINVKTGTNSPNAGLENVNDRVIEKQNKVIELNDQIIEAQNKLKELNTKIKDKQGGQAQ